MDKGIQKATAAIVLNSLGGGVVPRVGLEYITVGRRNEIGALLQDVELIQAVPYVSSRADMEAARLSCCML